MDVLTIVAGVLIVFVPFDWYVAYRLARAAWQRPRIPALNAAALVSVAIAIAASLAAVLGINSISIQATGVRLIPAAASISLLAIALVVVSLPNFYLLRLLRRWDAETRSFHIHHRDGENAVVPHRRIDDPKVGDADEENR